MAKKAKKKAKKTDGKRDGYEGFLLRMRPEVKELLAETVEGMNDQRKPGDPAYTMNGVILMAIANTFGSLPASREQTSLKFHKGAA